MQFFAFEQLNHNPGSLREAMFGANMEYNAAGESSYPQKKAPDFCMGVFNLVDSPVSKSRPGAATSIACFQRGRRRLYAWRWR
jgi:hypothetical protein